MSHARTRLRAIAVAALAIAISGSAVTPAHAEPSTSDTTKKIDKASEDLEDITESYNKIKLSLKKTKADEKKLAESLGPAREALDAASAQMATMAATAYKTGQVSTMNVMLEGPGDLMQKMSVLDQLSRTRQREISAYTATARDYTARQAALKATRDKQTAEIQELAARRKKIEADLKKLYQMRTAAYGRAQEKGTPHRGSVPSVSGNAGAAVRYAYSVIGRPYLFGAGGPNSFDCSGLTSAAWAQGGKSLPHNAAAQWSATRRISRAELAPGDLVFYRALGHVGIYVGNDRIIDAPRAGTTVKERSINIMPPYGYGRP